MLIEEAQVAAGIGAAALAAQTVEPRCLLRVLRHRQAALVHVAEIAAGPRLAALAGLAEQQHRLGGAQLLLLQAALKAVDKGAGLAVALQPLELVALVLGQGRLGGAGEEDDEERSEEGAAHGVGSGSFRDGQATGTTRRPASRPGRSAGNIFVRRGVLVGRPTRPPSGR